MGALSMSFTCALMIGAPLGGASLQRLGANATWGGCLVIGVLAGLLTLMVRNELAVGESQQ